MISTNITFYTKYESLGASSRLRAMQFFQSLYSYNINLRNTSLISNYQLFRRYQNKRYEFTSIARSYLNRIYLSLTDKNKVIWIEKELFPWAPAWFELVLIGDKKYILDFDDAIFHNYDLHQNKLIRKIYGKKIDKLMSRAAIVTAGNNYLRMRAVTAGAQRVEILPTVIQMSRYEQSAKIEKSSAIKIVWIGSPSTSKYLSIIAPALIQLAQENDFIFRVIGETEFSIQGVRVENIAWSEETEVNLIASSDIGIMPLEDNPWELGKCAYKLIQYMACGLPTVSSPVGANKDVVIEGETGYFAVTTKDWVRSLNQLLSDAELRKNMGENGLTRVKNYYTIERQVEQMADLFIELDRQP